MKRFWIAVILFSALIIISIASAMYIKLENQSLLSLLDEVAAQQQTSDTTALLKLRNRWDKTSYKYSTFVGHDKISEIERMLDELEAVWNMNSQLTVELRMAGIRSMLTSIEQNCFPSLHNIL